MAKGYTVVCYSNIRNQEAWAAYAKIAGPAMQKAGGRFIVRGSPAQTYEQGVKERVVIVEFDSVQKAIAAHDSPDYQQALKALGDGAERDMRVVEGAA